MARGALTFQLFAAYTDSVISFGRCTGGQVHGMLSEGRPYIRLGRLACAVLCLAALVWGAGCRKSGKDLEEEAQSEREELLEAQWRFQQAEARARNLYDKGKGFQRSGRYKDALYAWAEAVGVDDRVGLQIDLAKNLMAADMVERAHYQMHRPFEDPAYPRTSRWTLELIVAKNNGFMEKHVKKASKELDEWEWIKGGWEKYARAKRLIDTHQLAEGLDILEGIAKNYQRTPVADPAIKILTQYGRN